MTKDEAQKLYKWDPRPTRRPASSAVFALPDDVILNTRRAFSVSTTNPNGYSDLGAPEGRYFAPANSADCIQLKPGDCAPRAVVLLAPWFTRFDIGLTKKSRSAATRASSSALDVLNVFNNINFTVTDDSRTPGSGGTASSRPTRRIAISITPTIRAAVSDSWRFDSTGDGRPRRQHACCIGLAHAKPNHHRRRHARRRRIVRTIHHSPIRIRHRRSRRTNLMTSPTRHPTSRSQCLFVIPVRTRSRQDHMWRG